MCDGIDQAAEVAQKKVEQVIEGGGSTLMSIAVSPVRDLHEALNFDPDRHARWRTAKEQKMDKYEARGLWELVPNDQVDFNRDTETDRLLQLINGGHSLSNISTNPEFELEEAMAFSNPNDENSDPQREAQMQLLAGDLTETETLEANDDPVLIARASANVDLYIDWLGATYAKEIGEAPVDDVCDSQLAQREYSQFPPPWELPFEVSSAGNLCINAGPRGRIGFSRPYLPIKHSVARFSVLASTSRTLTRK